MVSRSLFWLRNSAAHQSKLLINVKIRHICSSKNKMQVDQDVLKNQSDDQKESADKRSDIEEMEVCEFTHLHTDFSNIMTNIPSIYIRWH